MIEINNSFFFEKKGLDLNNSTNFKKKSELSKKRSDELLNEFKNDKNDILKSFTKSYQFKIRSLKQKIDIKKKQKVVIGIGGSSSGAKALSFFMNDDTIFFDNLDYDFLIKFFNKNSIENFFFFVISKSGDTFETLAILNILIQKYKNQEKSLHDLYKSMVIITESKDSILKNFSLRNDIKLIEHNPNIGGRYSILSETGILPFLDLNLEIERGSEKYINFLTEDHDKSPTRNVAILATIIEEMKLSIYCNLIYNYRLKHFSYWFHQLHAESLGKKNTGLTPITSICPKDHHSMMQLYLDGPKNKVFNIFSPSIENLFKNFDNLGFYNIENYTPTDLLTKQFEAVVEVFKEKKIPHRVIKIDDYKNPLNLIELFSYFLLETILLGKVLGVDPYNQPAVQLIKNKIFKN